MAWHNLNLLQQFPRFSTLDLEIAKPDIDPKRPFIEQGRLGIACLALATYDKGEVSMKTWTGKGNLRMTPVEVDRMVHDLYTHQHHTPIFGWNSAAFDWRVIIQEANGINHLKNALCQVAKNHYDMMLMCLAAKGYRVGLGTMAEGMGVTPKQSLSDLAVGSMATIGGQLTRITEENKASIPSGALAPLLWAQGGSTGRQAVIKYCQGDALTTLEIAKAMMINGGLNWTSKQGNPQVLKFRHLATVEQIRSWPVPDTSWMEQPAPNIPECWEWMYEVATWRGS